MTNGAAIEFQAKAIADTFNPDRGVVELYWTNANVDWSLNEEYVKANELAVVKIALELVQGFVRSLDIEGDIHVNTYWEAVRANIIRISNKYGLSPEEYIQMSEIRDASYLW